MIILQLLADYIAPHVRLNFLTEKYMSIGIKYFCTNFTIEAIDLCDLPALVVAPQQGDTVGVLGLQGQQLAEGLQAVVAAVHKVSLCACKGHILTLKGHRCTCNSLIPSLHSHHF